ncbi:hypothetical protein [Xanthomonas sontii]|uniref:hypothetical protein n=1 Tax=Xanthomonas sontii TaxID=2650745 RepID=UPI00168C0C8E|nr:hypothetical protein [Xanthomonas sontii]
MLADVAQQHRRFGQLLRRHGREQRLIAQQRDQSLVFVEMAQAPGQFERLCRAQPGHRGQPHRRGLGLRMASQHQKGVRQAQIAIGLVRRQRHGLRERDLGTIEPPRCDRTAALGQQRADLLIGAGHHLPSGLPGR